MRSDAALVELASWGDAAAFAELYVRYHRLVLHILAERVSDPELRLDLSQEVFTRALESLTTLREPARFRQWLAAITRNVVVDAARQAGRLQQADPDDAEALADTAPTPEEVAETLLLAEGFSAAARELTTRDALALSMASLGSTAAEIAAALGMSAGASKVALHRARQRLQRLVALRHLMDTAEDDPVHAPTPPVLTASVATTSSRQ